MVMLRIIKGESNELIVTATEKVTIDSPVFLLVFKHQNTSEQMGLIVTDTSSFPVRYNKFTIVEGTDITLQEGTHDYKIYAQTSMSNTDPTLADEEVERGLAWVYDSTVTPTAEYEMDSTVKAYSWN